MAASQPEPTMPSGVDRDVLLDFLTTAFGEEAGTAWWKWLTTTHRGWGQDGWKRVDSIREACRALTPPSGPP